MRWLVELHQMVVGIYKNLVEQRVGGVPVEVGRDGGLGQRASPQDEAVEQPPQEKAPHPALMSFSSFSSCATFVAHVTFSSAHVAAHSTRVALVTFSSCTFKLTRRLCIFLNKCLHWPIFKFLHWPIIFDSPSLVSLSFFSFLTHVTSLVFAKKVSLIWQMPKMHLICLKKIGKPISQKSGHPDQCESPGAQSLTVCLRLEKETGRPGRPGRSGAGCSKPTCRQKRSHLQMQITSAYKS